MYLRHKIVTAVMALSVFTASAAGTGALASDDGNKKNASPAEPDVAVVMPDKPEGREAVKHCPSLSYGFEIVRRSRKMKKTSATSDVTFSHADFEEFCGGGVRTVTVTSLPPAEEGVLKLGALDVFEGQRLGAELLDLLVFVPSHPGSGSSFTFSVNDGGDVECVMYSAQYGMGYFVKKSSDFGLYDNTWAGFLFMIVVLVIVINNSAEGCNTSQSLSGYMETAATKTPS